MKYEKFHLIDEEMHHQLLEMFGSTEEDGALAVEIIVNADTDDLNTCFYIEDLALVFIFSQNKYAQQLKDYYFELRKQPNWKKVQESHKAFSDEIYAIDDFEYKYDESGILTKIKQKINKSYGQIKEFTSKL
jgi:gamma-glutamyl phosphate reductase